MRFRRELEAWRGDEGARSVLKENASLVTLIAVDDRVVATRSPDDCGVSLTKRRASRKNTLSLKALASIVIAER